MDECSETALDSTLCPKFDEMAVSKTKLRRIQYFQQVKQFPRPKFPTTHPDYIKRRIFLNKSTWFDRLVHPFVDKVDKFKLSDSHCNIYVDKLSKLIFVNDEKGMIEMCNYLISVIISVKLQLM